MRREIRYEAAGVVLWAGGRVLVLERGEQVRLPKGHIEPGEDEAAAALRELTEESGYCDVELGDCLGTVPVMFDADSPTDGPVSVTRNETYFAAELCSDRRVKRAFIDERFTPVWMEPNAAVAALTFAAESRWVEQSLLRLADRRAPSTGRSSGQASAPAPRPTPGVGTGQSGPPDAAGQTRPGP